MTGQANHQELARLFALAAVYANHVAGHPEYSTGAKMEAARDAAMFENTANYYRVKARVAALDTAGYT